MFGVLAVSLALAVYLTMQIVASLVAAFVWLAARADLDRSSARSRADGLFLLRVFPTATAATLVAGVFLPAFWRFEPRETGEMVGESLVAIAALSAFLILLGLRRGWQASRATGRVQRDWLRNARPLALPGMRLRAYAIDTEFPVVSLVGVLRPRLFVSEKVLHACAPEELTAMVRHECGHLAARDNLKRLLARMCPIVLPPTHLSRDLDRHWHDACEEAADDYAVRASAPSALALANGLLRVARLAPAGFTAMRPGAWLYSGGSIERRVRRLVASGPTSDSRAGWVVAARALALAPAVVTCVALLDPRLLHQVHHLLEVIVEVLP
jgi:Zn-dependent protease with chaperone function